MGMYPEGTVKGGFLCAIIGAKRLSGSDLKGGGPYHFESKAYVDTQMNGEIFDFTNFEEFLNEISLP